MFTIRQKKAKAVQKSAKLHSIAASLAGRAFQGSFDVAGASYSFTYAPRKAEAIDRKLRLTGNLIVIDGRPNARVPPHDLDNVRALLATAQGGIGTAPARPKDLAGSGQPAAPTVPAPQQGSTSDRPLPVVESTGPLSFCGVMYFNLEPIDARALGVPADLSKVQLNARLAPTDNEGRALHGVYSAIVEALYGKPTDERLAAAAVAELNKMLNAN